MKPFDADHREPTARLGQRLDPLWRAVVRHPVVFILLTLALTVVFGTFLAQLKIDPSLEALIVEDSPAKISYRNFIDQYGSDEFMIVAARAPSGDLFTPDRLRRIIAMSKAMAALPKVVEVQSLSATPIVMPTEKGVEVAPLYTEVPEDPAELARLKRLATSNPLLRGSIVSADGTSCVWLAFPDLRKSDDTSTRVALYQGAIAAAAEHLEGFEVHFEGVPTVKALMVHYIERGMLIFGTASTLLLGLVLFVFFRSLRGVALPALVVFFALIWTLGLMGATGGALDTISSLIFALILVVGVGDTVHILVHYQEEYFNRGDRNEALLNTMRRMFTPCLLTSVTTAIGFASLVTIRIPPIQRFGLYAATGVLAAFVISILLAPAVLRLLPKPSEQQRLRYRTGFLHGALVRLGEFNLVRRRAILVVAFLLLVGAGFGINRIQVETRVSEFFHPWSPIVRGYRFLEQNLTPPIPMEIVFEAAPDTFKEPATWQWIEQLNSNLEAIALVGHVASYGDVLKELNWAFQGGDEAGGTRTIPTTRQAIAQYSLVFQMGGPENFERLVNNSFSKAHISLRLADSSSAEQAEVIARIRSLVAQHAPSSVRWDVTGGTVVYVSVVEALIDGQIRSLTMAMVVITLLITLLFRSIRIGLLSMIPNVLPILTMLGLMGWLGLPLDTNTVMIGPITLGIAVDDTIHFITRYRRELKVQGSSTLAMKGTLLTTGRALMSTSIILAAGFSVTILSSFRPQAILGGLGGTTIMLALIADLILLPAVLLTLMKGKSTRA